MWSRNTIRARVRTYLSSVAGTFLWSSATTGEHTQGSWQVYLSDQRVTPFAWETSESLPLAWATSTSLPSVQNYRPYIVFQVQRIFLFMDGHRNLHTSVFFPVIYRSYMRTERSVILSTGNKLHFFLSCETTLLILSCNLIESANFIVAT